MVRGEHLSTPPGLKKGCLMIVNRSVPCGIIVPCLFYDDVTKAIDWLCDVFGCTERLLTAPEHDKIACVISRCILPVN